LETQCVLSESIHYDKVTTTGPKLVIKQQIQNVKIALLIGLCCLAANCIE